MAVKASMHRRSKSSFLHVLAGWQLLLQKVGWEEMRPRPFEYFLSVAMRHFCIIQEGRSLLDRLGNPGGTPPDSQKLRWYPTNSQRRGGAC
jgi:hypothetical protein